VFHLLVGQSRKRSEHHAQIRRVQRLHAGDVFGMSGSIVPFGGGDGNSTVHLNPCRTARSFASMGSGLLGTSIPRQPLRKDDVFALPGPALPS